jgi:tripartite-type tricarboxylate transporter receptor subunit TctC
MVASRIDNRVRCRRTTAKIGSLLLSLALLPGLAGAGVAQAPADEYFLAGKTVNLIVGMPPGGGEDLYARLVQSHLDRALPGAPTIVVQNLPGAGSLRSVMALGYAAQDGSEIGTFSSSLILAAILAPERVKIDFRKFAFLGNISEDIRVCYLRRDSGIASMADLVGRAGITFGATATGTSGNVDTAILRHLFGVKIKQVDGYAGSAEKRLALEKGEIDGDCGGFTTLPADWLTAGKINFILRLSPTLLPGMDPAIPFGGDLLHDAQDRLLYDFLIAPERLGRIFMVSSKVPPDRLAVLRTAFARMMEDPAFIADAGRLRLTLTPMSGAEVDRRVAELYTTPAALLARARDIIGE